MRRALLLVLSVILLAGCGSVDSRKMTCGEWRKGSSGFKNSAAADFAKRNINAGSKSDAAKAAYDAIDATCRHDGTFTQDAGKPWGDDFKPHDDAVARLAQNSGNS